MASYEEKMKGQADRLSGHLDSDHAEKGVKSEVQDLPMHINDPKTAALDSNKGSGFMGKAVAHLNRETQRGEHAPVVGGYQHDHKMGR
jgi:hypothetical protein